MAITIKGRTVFVTVVAIGTVVTAYFAAKKAPDAQQKKEAALQEKRERTGNPNAQLTFVESIKAQIGSYAPAIVSAVVTLGSLVGSEVINKENLKRTEKALDDFKEMTEKLDGKGAAKTIEKAVEQKKLDEKNRKPWDVKESFRIVFQGHSIIFEATRADVIEAIYETNRYFHGRGIVKFNEFLHYLGLDPVEGGDERGWECYVGEAVYGYTWIDFGLKECEDEPWITEIYMACYPHFFEQEECEKEIDEFCAGKLNSGDEEDE